MNISLPGTQNKKTKKCRLLFLAVGAFLALGKAQGQATVSFPVLSLGLGARGAGMGDSFTAVSDDASALYYNPAGLARLFCSELTISHNNYLPGGFAETVGYVQPLDKGGALGFSFQYLNYGNIDTRGFGGGPLGPGIPEDMDASLGYGFSLTESVGMGFRAQWLRESLYGAPRQGLMGDFGLLVGSFDRFYFGLDFKSMGIETGGSQLPLELLLGSSYRVGLEPSEKHSIIFSLGEDLLFQSTLKLNAGIEYGYLKRYFLRAGYDLDLQDPQFNSMKGLSLGAGVRWGQVQANYSFSALGSQGGIHRIAISLFFPPMERPSETINPLSSPRPGDNSDSSQYSAKDKSVEMKFEVTETAGLTKDQLFEKGLEKEKLGLREEAIDLYLKTVDKDPDFEKAWTRLGRLFLDKSLEAYRRVLEKNPGNKKLREWLKNLKF